MKKSEKWMLFAVLGALAIVGLCLVCIVGAILVPMRWWSQGGAAGAAKDYLGKSAIVQAELGKIREFGRFPMGSESVINGKGTAHFTITVRGERAEGTAELDLAKESGQAWRVLSASLTVNGKTVPLEHSTASPPASSDGSTGEGSPPEADQGSRDV